MPRRAFFPALENTGSSPFGLDGVPTQHATQGDPYTGGYSATAYGGTAPYAYSGSLPSGLAIGTLSGALSGTPSGSGTIASSISATDSASHSAGPNPFNFIITPSGGGVTPLYPPPGGVGSNIFNFDASILPNGTLSFPGFANHWFGGSAGEINQVYTATAPSIVDGQLVLELLDAAVGGQGMAVTSNPSDAAETPFSYSYGYREISEVITRNGWWSSWQISQPSTGYQEFDATERLGSGICATWHFNDYAGSQQWIWSPQPTEGEEVVFGYQWQPGKIDLYVNGTHTFEFTDNISGAAAFLIHNMGYYSGYSTTGATVKINYDRVWNNP